MAENDVHLNGGEAEEQAELLDYYDEPHDQDDGAREEGDGQRGYVGIHMTGFKDFQLKPELLRAIKDCGFEHPSEGGKQLFCKMNGQTVQSVGRRGFL